MPVSWSSLRHAQGPATKIPTVVKSLCKADPIAARIAFAEIGEALFARDTWHTASVPTFDLLLESLERAVDKVAVLVAAAEIAGSDSIAAWLAGPRALRGPQPELEAAARRHAKTIDALLERGRANERAAAWLLAAVLPGALAGAHERARAAAARHEDATRSEAERVAALLALGRLGEGDAESEAIVAAAMGASSPSVRGAAALTALRLSPQRDVTALRDGVAAWLGFTPNYDPNVPEAFAWQRDPLPPGARFPWFAGDAPGRIPKLDMASRGLTVVLSQRPDAEDLPLLSELGSEQRGVVARNAGATLLAVVSFHDHVGPNPQWQFVAMPQELTPRQDRLARRLASMDMIASSGNGVAAAGRTRQRWLGLAAPGPLEREVAVTLDGQSRRLPFWRAWVELANRREFGRPIPPSLQDALSGPDRWEAIIEFGGEAYGGPTFVLRPDEIDAILADAGELQAVADRAVSLADELAKRAAIAQREGRRIGLNHSASLLLFLPIVRAGRDLASRWDVLLLPGEDPQTREILTRLPLERRDELLWAYLTWVGNKRYAGLPLALALLDLIPSKRIATCVWERLNDPDVQKDARGRHAPDLERFRDLARDNPMLADIVAGKPAS